ncbi:clarin-3 [Ornithorhynchus anatinus]|uniref:Clarin 3 n=1 Tax=Ornithorhynchus anatinus TaxID=9258 RepID=A0A6I8P8B6_ORNAN|nr:clarin-3 [Ornithorhynchus anatinus]
MPSVEKKLLFLSAFLTSLAALVVVCSVLGTQAWVTSRIAMSNSNSSSTIVLTYGLLRGVSSQEEFSGLGLPTQYFEVISQLKGSDLHTIHSLVILFLVLAMLCSLLSAGLNLYNTISNPAQTFLGPSGVYASNAFNVFFIILSMILFAVNMQINNLSVALVKKIYQHWSYREATHRYGYSYWLMLLVLLLDGATTGIIVAFQHMRYKKRQQQKRPMEYAPKDGMLF